MAYIGVNGSNVTVWFCGITVFSIILKSGLRYVICKVDDSEYSVHFLA